MSLQGVLISVSHLHVHRFPYCCCRCHRYGITFALFYGWLVTTVVRPTHGMEPSFDVPIVNVTVVAGQTAVLPCSIEFLGKYKVAWLDHNSIPLTYEDRRVVDDARFSIIRPYQKEWNLQVRDIRSDDQGQYRCTINTNPVKNKVITLHVKVPASIIDHLSSDDVTVQEGETVVLVCNATGVPSPDVAWYIRPASSKSSDRQRIGTTGEMIIIHNVTRYCDDIYECVATNGVPPSVSRQIRVTVEFSPEITMPNRRMGQGRGRETILECIITAFPHAVNYWEKDGRRISSSAKYRIEAYDEGDHMIVLSLRIHDVDQLDFGEYKCVASNPLGQDQQVMNLYEYNEPASSLASEHNTHLDQYQQLVAGRSTYDRFNFLSDASSSTPLKPPHSIEPVTVTVPARRIGVASEKELKSRLIDNGGITSVTSQELQRTNANKFTILIIVFCSLICAHCGVVAG